MTNRRAFLCGLVLGKLAAPLAVKAQPATKVTRIGYLGVDLAADDPRAREAFLKGLRDLGYMQDHNLLVEYRDAKGKPERFPALATELVASKVEVIVTAGGRLAALAAKRATATIPVVFTGVGDPVADGWSPPSRDRVVISQGCRLSSSWSTSFLNYSSRPFRRSVESPSS